MLKGDIQKAGGLIQTCTGVPSGIEAAIHATRQAFEHEGSQALLLVDASNAFNSLNRQAAVHNIKKLCPPLYRYIHNTYQTPSDLIISNHTGEDGYINPKREQSKVMFAPWLYMA